MAGNYYTVSRGPDNAPVYHPIAPPAERAGPHFTWTIKSWVSLRVFGDTTESPAGLIRLSGDIELFWQRHRICVLLPAGWVPLVEFRARLHEIAMLRNFICQRDRRRYSWSDVFYCLWLRRKVEVRERWGSLPEDCRAVVCPSAERLERQFAEEDCWLRELAEGLLLSEVEARVVPSSADVEVAIDPRTEPPTPAKFTAAEEDIFVEAVAQFLGPYGGLPEDEQRRLATAHFRQYERFRGAYRNGEIVRRLWRKVGRQPALPQRTRGRPPNKYAVENKKNPPERQS